MTSILVSPRAGRTVEPKATSRLPGLVLVGLGLLGAMTLHETISSVPLIVAAVLTGAAIGNAGLATAEATPGLNFASKSLLRSGIVLLGLRLSIGDVRALGLSTLVVIVVTVVLTFFGVQLVGRRLGLSPGLSLLVASGFSICGNSAIASVKGVTDADDDEVAAAIGLVTLCGTAAILAVPALGSLIGLDDTQLGIWTGASVQDTAQVIAVATSVGPTALAVATAVKLTRVLFLAPIVAGVSVRNRRARDGTSNERPNERPAVLPLFVLGFLAALIMRSSGVLPGAVMDAGGSVDSYLLAAGVVGLGSSVRIQGLRNLGLKPLLLGAAAWLIVGSVSLALILTIR